MSYINLKFIIPGLAMLLSIACNETANQKSNTITEDSIPSALQSTTFQEIGFFGHIKKEKWDGFLEAVQNNIAHSRKEKGNLSFSLFLPEDGALQPIWFERFRNKEAHHSHKKQRYFKDAIVVIQKSLAEEAKSIELIELNEIPAASATPLDQQEKTYHLITLFDLKPGRKQSFINIMTKLVKQYRHSHGNLEFNIYRYADDQNKFVLIAGWQKRAYFDLRSIEHHIKHLSADPDSFFMSAPMHTSWIANDISQ